MESNGHSLTHEQRLILRTIGTTFTRQLQQLREELLASIPTANQAPLTVTNEVKTPSVRVAAPVVNVEAPTVYVEAPTTNVEAPTVNVDVEAVARSIDSFAAMLESFLKSLTEAVLVLVNKKPATTEPRKLKIVHDDRSVSWVTEE